MCENFADAVWRLVPDALPEFVRLFAVALGDRDGHDCGGSAIVFIGCSSFFFCCGRLILDCNISKILNDDAGIIASVNQSRADDDR
jgi:hypothetical protein